MALEIHVAWSFPVPEPFDALRHADAASQPLYASADRVVGAYPTWFCLDRANGSLVWARKIPEVNSILGIAEPGVIVATWNRSNDMGWSTQGAYGISLASGAVIWRARCLPWWMDGDRIGCRDGRLLDARTGERAGRWDPGAYVLPRANQLPLEGIPAKHPAGARVYQDTLRMTCRAEDGRTLWAHTLDSTFGVGWFRLASPLLWSVAWSAKGSDVVMPSPLDICPHPPPEGIAVVPVVVAIDARSESDLAKLALPCDGMWRPSETRLLLHADPVGAALAIFDTVFALRVSDETQRPDVPPTPDQ